ncbi:probable JmjC domain-containing histone demethylation protein 2C isoform X4 [Candoia aspera]|uniref:probable JmjC domain-containing histone demethylation protein 2C isoform X4 n=1 Tax=Candoia aspera TaxID=51853 RepID=UPI002FD8439E
MAVVVESRPELVGKRFLCVGAGGEEPPENGRWRAGVIRTVSHRDSHSPELSVYVEFDDLEWEKREWVKVYEDFAAFLVEYQLIWAKRKDPSQSQGSKIKHIQWPALTFKPLVGKSVYSSITAVEFLVDKQLDFVTEDGAFQPYQDDVDSLNPVLRDNPQLQEEVKIWVKEQKVQEIFMQGPYSLNGYRVRVYRQDSATQWFTGIITHHDLFTRTMIVMNDQVLEPQNVDPSMVQMTFLDDVVHSLLKGENIGITSRRRSRSSQNSNTAHGHYTRAQANSPRPAMNSQNAAPKQNSQQQQRNTRPNKRKGSDSSMPEEEKPKEEKYDCIGQGENSKSKNKLFISKRRKPEEDEKKLSVKRQRTDNTSDCSESSDSENSNKRLTDSSSEQNSDSELKNKNIVNINGKEGKSQSEMVEEQILIGNQSPWHEVQEDTKHQQIERPESADLELQEISLRQAELPAVYGDSDNDGCIQEYRIENKHPRELLPNEKFVTSCPTPKSYIDTNAGNSSVNQTQENLSSTFSLQSGQELESPSSDSKHLFTNANFLEVKKSGTVENWINNASKMELMQSNVVKNISANEHFNSENVHCGSVSSLTVISLAEQGRVRKQTPASDAMKSKTSLPVENSKIKPNSSQEIKYKPAQSPDTVKSKVNYLNSHVSGITKAAVKTEHDLPRSSFHPIPARISSLEATKSPLIIDKKEHFTIYRDPVLLGQETGTNHMPPYLHQHNYPPHSTSHRTCLNPSTHHSALTGTSHLLAESSNQTPLSAINTHPLSNASHHSVHQHLLPVVLPGVPTASLLGGHPQLETAHASSLSHLALAHQQQQQLLQHQSPHLLGQTHPSTSYNHLGLYPIIWQYPNGAHAYSGLGIPSSKWVHSEPSVNTETSLRRNTPSPWLHQPTPVTSSDGLGLLSHIPVRPSSAEPHRPLKLTSHSSPPLSKGIVDRHKDEPERKGIFESVHSAKSDLEHSRSQAAKEGHLQRHFVDPLQRSFQETGERLSKYKEEHRRILQESIEVAPFTAKMKALENERETYSRIMPLSSSSPKSHGVKPDKDSELYKMKHSVPQSLPQSNYFTTLSNSVVNEPPRTYLSKEISGTCADKQSTCPSTTAAAQSLASFTSSLSKPPPLIKHQPETESSVGKITDQLSQQMMSHSVSSFRSDSGSPTQLTVSSSGSLRTMPALHRAPVFHPPVHPTLERKEGSYSSLSPPTLTPVQPVNTGNKIHELQKPPTLVPEPKETQNVYKSVTNQKLSAMWKNNSSPNNEKIEWHIERTRGKSPSATASVIVRPPSSSKYDTASVVQSAPKEQVTERLKGINQTDCLKSVEAKETGRIVVSKMNSDVSHTCYEKNFPASSQGSVPSSIMPTTTVLCSAITDVIASVTASDVPGTGSSQVTDCLPKAGLPCTFIESTASRPINKDVAHMEECGVSTTASVTLACSKTESSLQVSTGFSGPSDFVHLKKHKAALAAAQFKINSTNDTESHTVKNLIYPASVSVDSAVNSSTVNKAYTLGGGQISQTNQANYHTKLKKAWLTRHSEEDKITNKKESSENCVSEMIKPCTVNLIASTSNDLQNNVDNKLAGEKLVKEEKHARRKTKRMYESGSESEDSDGSESKSEQRTKRQPKPTYKKKQNDLQKKKDPEEEVKPNGLLSRGAKEKNKLKLQSGNNNTGIPRSVLKDWRKVKKLKQTGESFLQDDSCYEIGPNLQKCRECRLIRSKKGEESAHSPVFCRFYYFRRLSFSKNGVVRIDGFSSPDQYDDEAMNLWTHESYDDDEMDLETCKYILEHIGDKFCQLVTSEKTAMSWVKKDAKIAWKRAVRGVREMCDACEATLFNIHWVCQKCGFVVCLDCYKAKERKSSRDKELYAWMKCVKGQPHDHKHLMPTQIIPGSVLTELVEAMHTLREKHEIKSHCQCGSKQNIQIGKFLPVNGVSQILQNVLNHGNKISLCIPELQQQKPSQKSEANGNTSPGSDVSSESNLNPPESQSPLHWLADLAEQKAREEKKENKDYPLGKHTKEEQEQDNSESLNFKVSTPLSQNNEQGSTLRDLLTTTAGKLRLGSTDAGIAFAPVYSTGTAL